jgi:hypothetical protein
MLANMLYRAWYILMNFLDPNLIGNDLLPDFRAQLARKSWELLRSFGVLDVYTDRPDDIDEMQAQAEKIRHESGEEISYMDANGAYDDHRNDEMFEREVIFYQTDIYRWGHGLLGFDFGQFPKKIPGVERSTGYVALTCTQCASVNDDDLIDIAPPKQN